MRSAVLTGRSDLHADIDEAEDHNDLERAARHRVELIFEFLVGP